MRVPVDTAKWSFVLAGEPEQVRDYETGQPRGNPDGVPLYRVAVLAMSDDEQEVLRVTVAGEPAGLVRAQPVRVIELTCRFWSQNGRSGLSYQAGSIAGTRLGDIDTLAVRQWLAVLERDEKVGASTRAKAYRLLARILALAVESGYLLRNPCTIKGAGTERAAEMRIASVVEVAHLADVVPVRDRALIIVAAYGGLRWGELAGLRAERVDLPAARVHVTEQVTEVNGQFTVGPPKTDAGQRVVALPRIAVEALSAHFAAFVPPEDEALVFPSPEGEFMRRSNFRRRVWLPATRAVGVEGLRFHDLRHTAATFALTAGANSRELMARIGHASSGAALRYQRVMEGRDEAIATENAAGVTGTRMARLGTRARSGETG